MKTSIHRIPNSTLSTYTEADLRSLVDTEHLLTGLAKLLSGQTHLIGSVLLMLPAELREGKDGTELSSVTRVAVAATRLSRATEEVFQVASRTADSTRRV